MSEIGKYRSRLWRGTALSVQRLSWTLRTTSRQLPLQVLPLPKCQLVALRPIHHQVCESPFGLSLLNLLNKLCCHPQFNILIGHPHFSAVSSSSSSAFMSPFSAPSFAVSSSAPTQTTSIATAAVTQVPNSSSGPFNRESVNRLIVNRLIRESPFGLSFFNKLCWLALWLFQVLRLAFQLSMRNTLSPLL